MSPTNASTAFDEPVQAAFTSRAARSVNTSSYVLAGSIVLLNTNAVPVVLRSVTALLSRGMGSPVAVQAECPAAQAVPAQLAVGAPGRLVCTFRAPLPDDAPGSIQVQVCSTGGLWGFRWGGGPMGLALGVGVLVRERGLVGLQIASLHMAFTQTSLAESTAQPSP